MTEAQWNDLVTLTEGGKPSKAPIGFIIDSPWLPAWFACEPIDWRRYQKKCFPSIENHQRIMWSASGGVPHDASSENMAAFAQTIQNTSNYSLAIQQ